MKRTVIQIGTHSLLAMFPYVTADRYVTGDLPYEGGWNARLTTYLTQASNEFTYECWMMEGKVEKPFAWERGGITFRLFPAARLKYIGECSRAMLRKAKHESQNEVLFTVHGLFNYTAFMLPLITSHTPIVIQHHGDLAAVQQARRTTDRSKKIGYRLLDVVRGEWFFARVSLPQVNHFFTLTKEVEEYLSHFVDKGKMQRLSMGVDLDAFFKIDREEAKKALGLDPDKRYVLYLGSMLPIKGIDYLIRALPSVLKQCSNTVLVLVGTGYYKTRLTKLIKQLGIEANVLMVPRNNEDRYVSDNLVPWYYNAAHVLVLPSLSEGLSVVLLEALACRTPIIATRPADPAELIQQLGGGVIIPPRSTDAIADAVIRVLTEDQTWTVDRERLQRLYDWRRIAQTHLEVYADLFAKYYE